MKRLIDIAVIAALALAGALLVGCSQNIAMPAEDTGTWLRVERHAVVGGWVYQDGKLSPVPSCPPGSHQWVPNSMDAAL
jgi:hypothetical protein